MIHFIYGECRSRFYDATSVVSDSYLLLLLSLRSFSTFSRTTLPSESTVSLLHIIPIFMWGRCALCIHAPPCSTVVCFLPQQSLTFDIIHHSNQSSSHRPSSLPSPVSLHFHRPPSYLVFLSSHHMPISLQPPFLNFLCDFPHFRCPSYSFISYLVQVSITAHPS